MPGSESGTPEWAPPAGGALFGSVAERQAAMEALRLRLAAMATRTKPIEGTTVGSTGSTAGSSSPRGASAGASPRSGTGGERRGRKPGGHPEDELGDPEAVAKSICLRLLTDSARPRANLFQALKKRGIAEDVANRVLDRYAELGLIDDDAYAQSYVRTKHKERGLGKRALAMELRSKGIDDDIAAQALLEVDIEDEWERGRVLIGKRIGSAMAAGPATARRRLVGLLARRGYSASMSYELVNSALRDYGVGDADLVETDDSL